ncbi:MAG: hypothetical protein JSR85_07575 [Proteobacteria bacterium]|nr:hypothetical protein [Pseudomonadota bacterium]
MYLLKKSLLISSCLFLGISPTWGMDEDHPDKTNLRPLTPSSETQASRKLPLSTLKTAVDYDVEDREQYRLWQERYKHAQPLIPDVETLPQDFEKGLATLKGNEKPLAHRGEIYGKGSFHKKVVTSSTREDVAYVGPTHMNYLQRDENLFPIYEAFAVPQEKDPQIDEGAYGRHHQPKFIEVYSLTEKKMKVDKKRDKRKLSPDDTDIVFDPGHGIDHAITITHNGSNSTADVRNYTPQNARYNRFIRNPLVQYAEEKKYSYKELAIYGEKPLSITRKKGKTELQQPIPEGFIFCLFDRDTGNIGEAFYFPNFYPYTDNVEALAPSKAPWEFFANKYKIKNEVAETIWGHNTVDTPQERRRAQKLSEHVGYRSLSGRFEVVPEGIWPSSARNALVRTVAAYRMERAAEYDATTENMLQIAQLFNDPKFVYMEFEGHLYVPHLARYWVERALKEVERKGYPAEDVFFFTNYAPQIPIKPQEMDALISFFEQKLTQAPNAEHMAQLLLYFDEQKNEGKYKEWSDQLSLVVKNGRAPQSAVINDELRDHLIETLADTDVLNIALDFEITQNNVGDVIEGFKQRAIREKKLYYQGLVFLELPHISPQALKALFNSFENGVDDLFVDVRGTTVKLPSYDRKKVQTYARKHYPQTHIRIFN